MQRISVVQLHEKGDTTVLNTSVARSFINIHILLSRLL